MRLGGLIRSFLNGLFLQDRERTMLLMLQAYVDESGSHASSDLFVLGGYVADLHRWERFTPAWRAALAAPPAIPYFHGREFYKGSGKFRSLTEAQKKVKIRALTEVIAEHVVCGVAAVVSMRVYESIVRGRVSPLYDSPYIACLCLIDSAITSIAVSDERVHVFLENRRGWTPRAIGYLDGLVPERRDIRTITSVTGKEDALPLQAADMFAWRISRRSHSDKESLYRDWEWEPLRRVEVIGTESSPGKKDFHAPVRVLRRIADDLALRFPPVRPPRTE